MTDRVDRPLGEAVRNGLRCRCPACGDGRLFASYLKVAPECPACGEALHHQRADDGPAYVTVLVVCHIAGVALHLLVKTGLQPWLTAAALSAVTVPLCLAMLPPTKGLFVAVQWSKRLHGFGDAGRAPA